MRVPWLAEHQYISVKDDGLVEILYSLELLASSGERTCKVVQMPWPTWVPRWAEHQCISGEDNGLIKVDHRPKLLGMISEMSCKENRGSGSLKMTSWEKDWCSTLKDEVCLTDVLSLAFLFKFDEKGICPVGTHFAALPGD